jgi:hypothetical protein
VKELPERCDHCNGSLKFVSARPHPERGGAFHMYECQACQLPMVAYVPSSEPTADGAACYRR